jgi:Zn-dependent metalloprotease
MDYYVDALNGSILKRQTHRLDEGTATILHQGNRFIYTKWHGGFKRFYSLETDLTRDIRTQYYVDDNTFYKPDKLITKSDNAWGTFQQKATTAHWCVTKSWDYFKNRYGKKGMGIFPKKILVRADASGSSNSAFYTQQLSTEIDVITFGYLNNTYRAIIDVAGHEYTHGLMKNWIKPVYEKESGALNESFADIFGFLVERYAQEGVSDWTFGEDAGTTRNMANPNEYNQPSTYKTDGYWYSTSNCTPAISNDYCGVHINSGIQNYWFHLLVEGGTGVNANNEPFQVIGIDVEPAATLMWHYIRNFITPSINYSTARASSVSAAKVLFGDCSFIVMQVENAWHAVGVGNRSICAGNPDLGDKETISTTCLLYPIPTKDYLNIQFPTTGYNRNLKIYDLKGIKLISIEGNASHTTISLQSLPSGVYFLRVEESENSLTYRFVKL